jgi:plastocyanin
MRRATVALGVVLLLASAGRAAGAVHQATVGNYYFQDDATNDRAQVVVTKGDQITFTVRAAAQRPHSVNVDELGIHSGDLILFETYTTPALNRTGTFRLYCRNHAVSNNHVASLVVRAPPTTSTTPTPPTTTTPRTATTPRLVPSVTTTMVASSTTVAQSTTAPTPARPGLTTTTEVAATVPAGRGKAPPGDRRRAAPAADSLEGLLGRHIGGTAPWTRAVRISVAALLPVVAVAAFALREARRREGGA